MNWVETFLKHRSQTLASKGPITTELERLKKITYSHSFFDTYIHKLQLYMEFALECGLDNQLVLYSCSDLAATQDPEFWLDEVRTKTLPWNQLREQRLSNPRQVRTIEMKLNPTYFAAILSGVKKYEGRAYDPTSDKDYADLREGDEIAFSINKELNSWAEECEKLNLNKDSQMICQVGNVYFSPTVHGMYQFCPVIGAEFQPMIYGVSEILELQRAAIYYSFPGYVERIKQYGFLGIEMRNPQPI